MKVGILGGEHHMALAPLDDQLDDQFFIKGRRMGQRNSMPEEKGI